MFLWVLCFSLLFAKTNSLLIVMIDKLMPLLILCHIDFLELGQGIAGFQPTIVGYLLLRTNVIAARSKRSLWPHQCYSLG